MKIRIKYTEFGEIYKSSIENIVHSSNIDGYGGDIDMISSRLDNTLSFCVKTVELLYAKGILNDSDLETLLRPYLYMDDPISEIKMEDE